MFVDDGKIVFRSIVCINVYLVLIRFVLAEEIKEFFDTVFSVKILVIIIESFCIESGAHTNRERFLCAALFRFFECLYIEGPYLPFFFFGKWFSGYDWLALVL